MATQSRAPTILLTRPQPQAERFAARLPGQAIVISPLLVPQFTPPALPDRGFAALILTSETGAQAAGRIAAAGHALPGLAYCVGDRTARAAQAKGFRTVSAAGDARALLDLIRAEHPQGGLLYLHGRETRGNLAEALNSAGIETVSAQVYAQNLQPLTPQAVALLQGSGPVLAPVFSPRSAQALADECARIAARALLTVAAISPAAALPFAGGSVLVAKRPDAEALIRIIAEYLASLNLPPMQH